MEYMTTKNEETTYRQLDMQQYRDWIQQELYKVWYDLEWDDDSERSKEKRNESSRKQYKKCLQNKNKIV